MENVNFHTENGVLTICLSGHIDSANSAQVENEINRIREENPAESVVIDCEKLEYISSAGLRIILRVKKAVPDTKAVNVGNEIYEVFEMTGFTEMMDIQKAYRVISVEGCEAIGRGANGKVYRIDPDTIVKVYLNPDALPEIQRERELARSAFVLGIPTAIPYDVVRIEGGGYGSVFELLNAKSLAQLLVKGEKSVDEIAEMAVALLKQIHSTVVKPDSMPDMKAVALDWAEFLKDYLEEDQYRKLSGLIAAVPDDNHMMHGDYHIKNVMLQNGEVLLIDMDTLCRGNPVFELASMFNAYQGFSSVDESVIKNFLGIDRSTGEELWNKQLRLYFEGRDEAEIKKIEEKAMLIGFTRIMRRSIRRGGLDDEKERKLIDFCRERIADLLQRIDTLEL
ncbi:MAG: anti-sigma factor antagonist [Solobacterium sp.]|nr:anti-sigma factor antagonist [Solobacterium sp.]